MKTVIIILLLLITVSIYLFIPVNRHNHRDAKSASAINDLRIIESGINYGSSSRNYSPSLGDSVVEDLFTNGLVHNTFTDPWGQKYVLSVDVSSNYYFIISSGKDTQRGTDDDICKRITNPNHQ